MPDFIAGAHVSSSGGIFNAIGNGYIPDIPNIGFLPEVHKLTLALGMFAIVMFIISEFSNRRKKLSYDFEVLLRCHFAPPSSFASMTLWSVPLSLLSFDPRLWPPKKDPKESAGALKSKHDQHHISLIR